MEVLSLLCRSKHPCLVEEARRRPAVVVTGYADYTFFLGPLQAMKNATPPSRRYRGGELQLKTFETLLRVLQWAAQEQIALAAQALISKLGSNNQLIFRLDGGDNIQLAHSGLKILGCLAGKHQIRITRLDLSCLELEGDVARSPHQGS